MSNAGKETSGVPCPIPFAPNGLWGYVDADFKKVVDFVYVQARRFHNGRAYVSGVGGSGYIDATGAVKVPLKYIEGSSFSEEGLARVSAYAGGGTSIVVDAEGTELFAAGSLVAIPVDGYVDGRLRVEVAGKYGFLDARGHAVVGAELEDALPFSEGLAAVKPAREKWFYIDTQGNRVFGRRRFDEAAPFSEGMAYVRERGKGMAIDKNGGRLFAVSGGDRRTIFKNGAAVTTRGYILASGKTIRPPRRFEQWEPFSEDRAAVWYSRPELGSWYAYIDKKAAVVIQDFHCSYAHEFQDGIAYVNTGRGSFINAAGAVVWPRQSLSVERESVISSALQLGATVRIENGDGALVWRIARIGGDAVHLVGPDDANFIVPLRSIHSMRFTADESMNHAEIKLKLM